MNGGIEYYFLVSSRKLFFLITEEKIFLHYKENDL